MTAQEPRPGTRAPSLLIIRNPAAGRGGGRFDRTLEALHGHGCKIAVRDTAARGDAEAFARAAAAAHKVDRVVAAGGDGTVNEVINGLAGSSLPLALLPLGTANVLAHEIGLDLAPETIARTIARGRPRPITLGRTTGAEAMGRVFVTVAGVGVDAHTVAGVDLALKRRIGKGAYVAEALRQLAVFPFAGYRVSIDGASFAAASAVVANGRFYAGRYVLAPDARIEDPHLHVCLFETGGRWPALRYALAMQVNRLTMLGDYRIVTGRRVRIEGPPGDPVQADGDIVAHLPVEIEAVPEALRLVIPAR